MIRNHEEGEEPENNNMNAGKGINVVGRNFIAVLLIFSLFALFSFFVYAQEATYQASVTVLNGTYQFITIYAPQDNGIFSSGNVLVNVSTLEVSKNIYYSYNNASFLILCSNCSKYSGIKPFPGTDINLTIRAQRQDSSYQYNSVMFKIDTIAPSILATSFNISGNNGTFSVNYTEANLVSAILRYGVNLENSIGLSCASGTKQNCSISVDLTSYDGKTIYYQFALSDPFRTTTGAKNSVFVDLTAPIINSVSPDSGFVSSGKFTVNYTESNEKSTTFEYGLTPALGSNANLACTSGVGKTCSTTINLTPYDGKDIYYRFTINDSTRSTSSDIYNVSVDLTAPKILATYPSGVANDGLFYVNYTEANFMNGTLLYGPNLENRAILNCPSGVNQQCTVNSDLRDFDGTYIYYQFFLSDPFRITTSAKTKVFVDLTAPIINSVSPDSGFVSSGKFTVNYTESNEKSTTFEYGLTPALGSNANLGCSSGVGKTCSTTISLNPYDNKTLYYKFTINDSVRSTSSPIYNVSVDLTAPKILSTLPRAGITVPANTTFSVSYTETNLLNAGLYYGTSLENRINLNCSSGSNQQCNTTLDLTPYDGKTIYYKFQLIDPLRETNSSKISINVDSVSPVINRVSPIGTATNGTFTVNYTENNLKSVYLSYGVNLENNKSLSCTSGIGKTCSTAVSLIPYNNTYINYKFRINDTFSETDSNVTNILVKV